MSTTTLSIRIGMFLLALSCTSSFCQDTYFKLPYSKETGLVTYQEVVTVDSVSKDKLFFILTEWFAKTYNKSTEVIQLSDKENGKLIGKGLISIPISASLFDFRHTVTIDIKDNKYRYTISGFYRMPMPGLGGEDLESYIAKYEPMGKMTNRNLDKFEIGFDERIKALIESMKKFVTEQKKKDTEW